ncbi:MAG: DNA-binding transcriptional LysR family regulator [Gammaproteobacteria bacterium]|jgi:DNA-binding transcriptional LysR family regulator
MEITENSIFNMHICMDWNSIKFDWNRARAFLVTAEEGSLSAAARALDMTQPTLGRQVSALEEELGVSLFERVGRGLNLTPSGLDLLEHVQAMGQAATRLSLVANGHSQEIAGKVCISASEIHAAYLLPSIVNKLRKEQPGIIIEIVSSNNPSDLLRREADIAIRSFRPTEAELISKKITDVEAPLFAAKTYLNKLGIPKTIDDLKNAEFVTIGDVDTFMKGLKQFGVELTEKNFPVQTGSHIVHWELVKQGLGIGIVPMDIGDAEPLVERVLPDLKLMSFPIWLTSHRELRTNKRIRLVFDFLAEELTCGVTR